MSASVPVTRGDFAKIGSRYSTEEIINEIDRLLPLAKADIVQLATGGYTGAMLAELARRRDDLRAASATRRAQRGAKMGARKSEAMAVEEGRLLLRKGIAMAQVAIAKRLGPEGEDIETRRKKTADLVSRVRALGGRTVRDAASLRTRLEGLKDILTSAEYPPPEGGEHERTRLLEKLERVMAAVTTHAETKQKLKDHALVATVDLDEQDGRAYTNLRLLSQVGRATFRLAGDPVHADAYSLKRLNRSGKKARAKAGAADDKRPATPEPIAPAPIAPQPSPSPIA